MRLDKTIVKKISRGDGLTNNELDQALNFYTELEEALDCLGPEFKLAWKEVMHTTERLRIFSEARNRKTSNVFVSGPKVVSLQHEVK